ncbi:MAG: hypothetical protein NTV57_08325 [Cyanobacteria bacterium]|nr:hypothetical protein [Cyanobacteriota bacterium]
MTGPSLPALSRSRNHRPPCSLPHGRSRQQQRDQARHRYALVLSSIAIAFLLGFASSTLLTAVTRHC